jgi:hypothetical protein
MGVPYFCTKSKVAVRKFCFWNVVTKYKNTKTTFALCNIVWNIGDSLHDSVFAILEITQNIRSQLTIQTGTGGTLEIKQNIGSQLMMIQPILTQLRATCARRARRVYGAACAKRAAAAALLPPPLVNINRGGRKNQALSLSLTCVPDVHHLCPYFKHLLQALSQRCGGGGRGNGSCSYRLL